jgi:hypothetical protein
VWPPEAAGRALGDDVIRAVDKEQGALVRGQGLASCAVHVVQTAVGRLDGGAVREGLRALGALHLHLKSLSRVSRPHGGPDATGRDARLRQPGRSMVGSQDSITINSGAYDLRTCSSREK